MDSQNHNEEQPNFLVIGPGAIGLTIGARLKMLGYIPQILQKGQNEKVLRRLFFGWGKSYVFQIQPISPDAWQRFDIVFCAVKAFQLDRVLQEQLPKLRSGCVIVPVANGATLGIIERYQLEFPKLIFRGGYCMFGSSPKGDDGYQLMSASPRLIWGPTTIEKNWKPSLVESALISRDRGGFFHCSEDAPVGSVKKWVFNTVMNTICCVQGYAKNKMLLNDRDLLLAVFGEAFALHKKLWPQSRLESQALWAELTDFITEAGENENSMYRDRTSSRQTESDFLAGISMKFEGFQLLKSLHQSCVAAPNHKVNSANADG